MPLTITELPEPKLLNVSKIPKGPFINARSYILIDSDTKYPFVIKDADKPVPIASTTKIMTAIVALETLPLDRVVTISSNASTIEGSEIFLMRGETMTVESLLYALLINSANDAAIALAEVEGTTDDFVLKMNAKAQLLGLQNTSYRDPAGLNDDGHSTPRDLANLMSYALRFPKFKEIIKVPKHTIRSADGRYEHPLENSNRLIKQDDPLYFANALGGKTGFTYAAGHCLVSVAQTEDTQYISVVLSTYEDTKVASAYESRKLLNWAIANLR